MQVTMYHSSEDMEKALGGKVFVILETYGGHTERITGRLNVVGADTFRLDKGPWYRRSAVLAWYSVA